MYIHLNYYLLTKNLFLMEINPVAITEEQYNGSMYGVSSNGDLWLLFSSQEDDHMDECVWLGNDPDALDNLFSEVSAHDCDSTEITVDGEDLPTTVCDMSIRRVQLDIDALRNGHVIWYSAAE